MDTLLRLSNVSLIKGGKEILKNISFTLSAGQFVTLVGPNGSGKTSLLRLCLKLLSPTKGTLHRSPALKIGYMPQKLFVERTLPLTVQAFLALGATKANILDALKRVGASRLLKSQLHDLSGGELQRVLLARSLLSRPNLLVLDEPVQGVDLGGQADLYHLIETYQKESGCAVLLVSHDLFFVHKSSDHVICLNQHICCSGEPESVKKDPAYQTLFGTPFSDVIAPYTHHHDHSHDLAPDDNDDDYDKKSDSKVRGDQHDL